jgi:hypothetical protein
MPTTDRVAHIPYLSAPYIQGSTDVSNNRQAPHNPQAVVPTVARVPERAGIVTEVTPAIVPAPPSANGTDSASIRWREGVSGSPELLQYLADRAAGLVHAVLLLVKRILSVLFCLVVIVIIVVAGLVMSGGLSGADLAAIIQSAVPY